MSRNELLIFDSIEYKQRLSKVRKSMQEEELDVAVITAPEDVFYLTGYPHGLGLTRPFPLVIPLDGPTTLVYREIEGGSIEPLVGHTIDRTISWSDIGTEKVGGYSAFNSFGFVGKIISDLGLANKRVGVQMDSGRNGVGFSVRCFDRLKEALPKANFIDVTDVVERHRLIKSPAEIEYMRMASRIASKGLAAGIDAVKECTSEHDVAKAVIDAMLESPNYEFAYWWPVFVCSGPRSAIIHNTTIGRIIRKGDLVYIEVGAAVNRYHGITLRTASVGPPSEKMQKVEKAVQNALDKAISAIKPGVEAGEVDEICRGTIAKAGFGKYFKLRSGYTIGAEWSQPHGINLVTGNSAELRPGMTFHVIPICMFFGEGAIGMSETVLVTEEGSEVLTELERKLFVK